MTNETTRRIAKTALMIALIFVCTFTIKLPNPATGGYTHMGDCMAFLAVLVRKYGQRIILKLCKKKDYDKYMKYTYDQKKFDTFFMLAIFLPCAPDDLLCMLAGLTHMSLKKFVWIILLGKPLSLIAYSYGLTQLFQIIERWL